MNPSLDPSTSFGNRRPGNLPSAGSGTVFPGLVAIYCDRAHQFWSPYAYSTVPVLIVDKDGNFAFLLAPILWNIAIAAGTDFILQMIQNGGDINKVRWGSVAFSGLAGGATSGFSQLAAAGKLGTFLAQRGFGSFFSRNLISGLIYGVFGTAGELFDRAAGRSAKPISDVWISAGLGVLTKTATGARQRRVLSIVTVKKLSTTARTS